SVWQSRHHLKTNTPIGTLHDSVKSCACIDCRWRSAGVFSEGSDCLSGQGGGTERTTGIKALAQTIPGTRVYDHIVIQIDVCGRDLPSKSGRAERRAQIRAF